MVIKYKKTISLSLFVALFIASVVYFKTYKPGSASVLGSSYNTTNLIPLEANYISQNKSPDGRTTLSFSTELSSDQVKKFYSELLLINKSKPCIYNISVTNENLELNIAKVTFCE